MDTRDRVGFRCDCMQSRWMIGPRDHLGTLVSAEDILSCLGPDCDELQKSNLKNSLLNLSHYNRLLNL